MKKKIKKFCTLVRHSEEEQQRETTLCKGKKRKKLGEGEEKFPMAYLPCWNDDCFPNLINPLLKEELNRYWGKLVSFS